MIPRNVKEYKREYKNWKSKEEMDKFLESYKTFQDLNHEETENLN